MDTGFTLKPLAGDGGVELARPAASTPAAAATELPPPKTVRPPQAVAAARNDVSDAAATHDVILDPQTRELVYRVLDAKSRRVVWQVPDEATLKMRAYAKALESSEARSQPPAQADLKV